MTPLFATFHGQDKIFGATFSSCEAAHRYPGPQMYECASKVVETYVPLAPFAALRKEWQDRLLDARNEAARTELLAAIGDLEDLIKQVS